MKGVRIKSSCSKGMFLCQIKMRQREAIASLIYNEENPFLIQEWIFLLGKVNKVGKYSLEAHYLLLKQNPIIPNLIFFLQK